MPANGLLLPRSDVMVHIDQQTFGPWSVVTGASSGIGKEFARQLAANGLNLVLVARRLPLLEELGAQLKEAHGIDYRAVGLDLTKDDFIEGLDEATHDLDVGLLISDAGAGGPEEFLVADHHTLRQVLHLNAIAHLDLAHHFGRRLAKRGRGGILLVSTMGARQAVPYVAWSVAVGFRRIRILPTRWPRSQFMANRARRGGALPVVRQAG